MIEQDEHTKSEQGKKVKIRMPAVPKDTNPTTNLVSDKARPPDISRHDIRRGNNQARRRSNDTTRRDSHGSRVGGPDCDYCDDTQSSGHECDGRDGKKNNVSDKSEDGDDEALHTFETSQAASVATVDSDFTEYGDLFGEHPTRSHGRHIPILPQLRPSGHAQEETLDSRQDEQPRPKTRETHPGRETQVIGPSSSPVARTTLVSASAHDSGGRTQPWAEAGIGWTRTTPPKPRNHSPLPGGRGAEQVEQILQEEISKPYVPPPPPPPLPPRLRPTVSTPVFGPQPDPEASQWTDQDLKELETQNRLDASLQKEYSVRFWGSVNGNPVD